MSLRGPLVEVDWLAGRLDDPGLRVADVRWYLDDPSRGAREYREAHLPGAVFLDLDRDLSDPEVGGRGRHPLPDPYRLAARLGELGIGDRHLVVAYDDGGGWVAARLWWLLRHLGHDRAAVLDGGMAAWREAGLTVTDRFEPLPRAHLTARPRRHDTIDTGELRNRLGEVVLFDARAPERYRGELEPVDPIPGHIPTARSAPYAEHLDGRGRLRPASELSAHYRGLGAGPGRTVVAYCGSGVTSCHTILALEVAGMQGALLYPGSYSEWSRAGLPVMRGPEPGDPPGRGGGGGPLPPDPPPSA